ncbi:MAG: DNA gyrase subunit A, partial [Lactobacillus iners]|nr:DNA gyrase subunit A [Lactobacillus iners]
IRRSGLIALNLRENDELSNVLLTDGSQNILIGTRLGYAVIFNENEVRTMGRVASGVRGIKLRANDYVVGSSIVDDHSEVLVISEKGYGKRTLASEYPIKSRGCMGVKTANVTE